jgi:hypothetical protein
MGPYNEPFSVVHESGERLTEVSGYFFVDETNRKMLVAVRLRFEREVVVLTANDDDSIGVFDASWKCSEEGVDLHDLSDLRPWNCVVDKPLLWSWTLTNQQGYFDGVQLQFGTSTCDAHAPLQLMVVAGEFKISVASPLGEAAP